MKKILLTILGLLAFVNIQAQEATLSFADKANRTVQTDEQQVWVQNGITLTNNKGKSTSNVADYAKPARFYKSSEIIIECSLGNIKNIVFDCNSASYATALGNSITDVTPSVSSDKVTVTLNGSSNRFVIESLTGGQVRMDAVTVTYGESDPNAVYPPTITPKGGEYVEGDEVEVTISGTAGQDFYYAINSDDMGDAEEYTDPLKVTSNTTIYAWASNGNEVSEAASATFNFTAPITSVEAFYNLSKDNAVKFIRPVTVVYQNGSNLIVKDETASMLVYGSVGQTYKNGDVIEAGIRGIVGEYGGNKQFVPTSSTFAAGEAGTAVVPAVKTVAELEDCGFLEYVKLEGVYFTLNSGKNYTVSDGTNTFAAYNQFGIAIEGLAEGVTYNVEGFMSSYNDKAQLQPISVTVADASGITGVSSVNEAFASALPTTWTSVTVSGDVDWYAGSYNSNYYAAMSAYKATEVPVEAWFISPALNVKDAEKKNISFKTQVNGFGSTDTEFKVYVLDNVDLAKATKTELSVTLAVAPAGVEQENGSLKYSYSEWVESGDIDLSAYGDVVYVAFYYAAPATASATWCVDDFTFNYVPENLGTKEAPITVAEAMAAYVDGESKTAWVTGYIVGSLNGSKDKPVFAAGSAEGVSASNLIIADAADCKDVALCMPVQLPSGTIRTDLNLVDNPANLGAKVTLKCNIEKYFSVAGLKSPSEYILDTSVVGIEEIGVDANAPVEYYNLQGVKVANPENGIFIKKQGNKTTKVVL